MSAKLCIALVDRSSGEVKVFEDVVAFMDVRRSYIIRLKDGLTWNMSKDVFGSVITGFCR